MSAESSQCIYLFTKGIYYGNLRVQKLLFYWGISNAIVKTSQSDNKSKRVSIEDNLEKTTAENKKGQVYRRSVLNSITCLSINPKSHDEAKPEAGLVRPEIFDCFQSLFLESA